VSDSTLQVPCDLSAKDALLLLRVSSRPWITTHLLRKGGTMSSSRRLVRGSARLPRSPSCTGRPAVRRSARRRS